MIGDSLYELCLSPAFYTQAVATINGEHIITLAPLAALMMTYGTRSPTPGAVAESR